MIKCNNENCKMSSKILLPLSFVALVLAGVVSLFQVNLWLAGTQWILVAILSAVYALIFSGEHCHCNSDNRGSDSE